MDRTNKYLRDSHVLHGQDRLYGTARPNYKAASQHAQFASGNDHLATKTKNKRRGRCIKSFVRKCFPCFQKSYSPHQESHASEANLSHPTADIHRCTQDHEKDAMYQNVISSVGRHNLYSSDLISAKSINVTVRNENDETESDGDKSHKSKNNETTLKKLNNRLSNHSLPRMKQLDRSVQTDSNDSSRQHTEETNMRPNTTVSAGGATSFKTVWNHIDSGKSRSYTETESKPVNSSVMSTHQNAAGTVFKEVKSTVSELSAALNQVHDQRNPASPRLGLREKSLHMYLPKSRELSIKQLITLRSPVHPGGRQLVTQMLDGSANFCYPRYFNIDARTDTLQDRTRRQLREFDQDALANAGWFFNGRILITFCCGMEMPASPCGNPQDVHVGLSPQCAFALSLQPLALDSNIGMQASGGATGFTFSIPVQVSDDTPIHLGNILSYDVHDTAGFPNPSFQESTPGDHWVAEAESAPVTQTSEDLYYRNIVTNNSELPPDLSQTTNRQQLLAQQRAADTERSEGELQSQETRSGQLSMRGNAQNPMCSHHRNRDPDIEAGRQSPPDALFPVGIDQLNLEGYDVRDHRPRYPQFGFTTMRLHSFEGWPVTHTQTPAMMSDAGFFYAGYGDSVLCYSCGIGARHWLPGDDVWVEHARLWPSCVFVKTLQGQHFIDVALEMTRNDRQPTYQQVKVEANRRQRAEEAADTGGSEQPLGEEELSMLCKVCYTRDLNTIVMPCRHLALCNQCILRTQSCPICHSDIDSTFRASF